MAVLRITVLRLAVPRLTALRVTVLRLAVLRLTALRAAVLSGVTLCAWLATATAAPSDPPWAEILRASPAAGGPPPLDAVVWRDDLEEALAEARRDDRPLFVTLRCLPCKQCADFDRDVLEGGPRLDPLLRRFVTVRLTDAAAIDLDLLPAPTHQDLDLSWWGYVLSPEGALYAVFGGRDEVSDSTRVSVEALARVLERVLAHHRDPRRASWGVDGPPTRRSGRSPRDLPGYASWDRRAPGEERSSCLHCHQVAEILRQPAIDAGTFDPARDLDPWPLPENVGLVLDRDDGLRVREVLAGTAAARAGLRAGDVLGAVEGRRVFGQTDVRAALHAGPRGAGSIDVVWSRGDEVLHGALDVEAGWRRTVLDWRMSVSQGNIGVGPGFWPNRGPRAGQGAMSVRPWMGPQPRGAAFDAGLRPGDEVVSVDGVSPDLYGRAFLVWFRTRKSPGDDVVVGVRDGDGVREVRYRLE